MAKRLQLRRGTTAQMSTFVGAVAEVTYDSDKKTLIAHDGATAGGFELAKQSAVDLKLDANANAVSATKLQTARTIALGGDVSGSANFDGTSNITITATVANDSHTHTFANLTSKPTTLGGYGITDAYTQSQVDAAIDAAKLAIGSNYSVATIAARNALTGLTVGDQVYVTDDGDLKWAIYKVTAVTDGAGSTSTFEKIMDEDVYLNSQSASAILSALLTVDGTGSLLDADLLDGQHGAFYQNATNLNAGTISDARLPATISSDITGNAATATKLATIRSISLGGDLSGSVNFDGSTNVTLTATIQPNSVALGTDTTGNYVAGATAGAGIAITGAAGEGWSPTIALASTIDLGLVTDAIS